MTGIDVRCTSTALVHERERESLAAACNIVEQQAWRSNLDILI
jgi:hypothetical protein